MYRSGQFCHACGKTGARSVCGPCGTVVYCGYVCHDNDRAVHANQCGFLRNTVERIASVCGWDGSTNGINNERFDELTETLLELPEDLLFTLASFLTMEALLIMRRVSRTGRLMAEHPEIWKSVLLARYDLEQLLEVPRVGRLVRAGRWFDASLYVLALNSCWRERRLTAASLRGGDAIVFENEMSASNGDDTIFQFSSIRCHTENYCVVVIGATTYEFRKSAREIRSSKRHQISVLPTFELRTPVDYSTFARTKTVIIDACPGYMAAAVLQHIEDRTTVELWKSDRAAIRFAGSITFDGLPGSIHISPTLVVVGLTDPTGNRDRFVVMNVPRLDIIVHDTVDDRTLKRLLPEKEKEIPLELSVRFVRSYSNVVAVSFAALVSQFTIRNFIVYFDAKDAHRRTFLLLDDLPERARERVKKSIVYASPNRALVIEERESEKSPSAKADIFSVSLSLADGTANITQRSRRKLDFNMVTGGDPFCGWLIYDGSSVYDGRNLDKLQTIVGKNGHDTLGFDCERVFVRPWIPPDQDVAMLDVVPFMREEFPRLFE